MESNQLYLNNKHIMQNKSYRRKWSLYAIIIYFIFQSFSDPFHSIVFWGSLSDLIGIISLIGFSLLLYVKRERKFIAPFELKVVIVWLVYLIISYLFDRIIKGTETSLFSMEGGDLRWILQSFPILILVVVRGLNKKELSYILFAIVIMMPFSIYTEYQLLDINSISGMQDFASQGRGVNYNTYLPFTTFPLFASVYLIIENKIKYLRILVFGIFCFILFFIFINPSRQSMLFVLFGSLIYIILAKGVSRLLLFIIAITGIWLLIMNLDLTDQVMSRFFSEKLLESNRHDYMIKGLLEMNGLWEWCFGNGLHVTLTDTINPHSNYVFSIMRTGLVGTALMFYPFIGALIKLIFEFFKHRKQAPFDRNLISFVIIGISFVLFHSYFGYPHIDALNGPIVWFCFALWVLYNNDLQRMAKAQS